MGNESESKWTRDILTVPLIVGVLLALAAYVIPKFLDKGKRLDYTVEGPTPYINPKTVGAVKITVDGTETPNLFAYRITVWNSGDTPLSSLPVLVSFGTTNPTFKLFSVSHETTPAKEFGRIEEKDPDAFSRRFVYELLNAKDADAITLLTSLDAPLLVFSKAEGLRVRQIESKPATSQQQQWRLPLWTAIASIMTAAIGWTVASFREMKKFQMWRSAERRRLQQIFEENQRKRPNG